MAPAKSPNELRRRAERRLKKGGASSSVKGGATRNIEGVVHELQVHQLELEMQNEELRLAKEELEASNSRYFELYNFAPVGYFTLDREGVIHAANLRGASLLGIERSKLLNRRFGMFVAPEARVAFENFLARVFAGTRIETCELPLAPVAGRPLQIRIEASTSEAEGDCRAAVSDITENMLTHREKERLQDLLFQSKKIEAVGRLAGGIAHDFNNMLNVILGHIEIILERGDPGDPLHEHFEEIQRAATRSSNITRQLLAFARKQTVSPRVINLNETVETLLKMIRRLIGEDIHLDWKPGAKLWNVLLDPTQMDQIVANLAANARDAITGVGNLRFETANVRLKSSDCAGLPACQPGDYVLLTAQDDGAGIQPDMLEHIFEPFFTTKDIGKGTGLGLATVYGIVTQNGGFIAVDSPPGRGTTFRIYLPRTLETPAPEETREAVAFRGTETLLLVEDEASVLQMVRGYLSELGYRVLASTDPLQALVLAKSEKIDILVTDIVMPGMNGLELAARVREAKPGLRTLFVSGYSPDFLGKRNVIESAENFVQKPYSLKLLSSRIRDLLDR